MEYTEETIHVRKNYGFFDTTLKQDNVYNKIKEFTNRYKKLWKSEDIVSYWMVFVNV